MHSDSWTLQGGSLKPNVRKSFSLSSTVHAGRFNRDAYSDVAIGTTAGRCFPSPKSILLTISVARPCHVVWSGGAT
jgi:hypothetical protein